VPKLRVGMTYLGGCEDRVDILEAEMAVMQERVAAAEKEIAELKGKNKRPAEGDGVPPPKRGAHGKAAGNGSGAGPSGTQPGSYAAKNKKDGRCYLLNIVVNWEHW
jgi:hypothetical protein